MRSNFQLPANSWNAVFPTHHRASNSIATATAGARSGDRSVMIAALCTVAASSFCLLTRLFPSSSVIIATFIWKRRASM